MANMETKVVTPVQKSELEGCTSIMVFPETESLMHDVAAILGEENLPIFVRDAVAIATVNFAKAECNKIVGQWTREIAKVQAKYPKLTGEEAVVRYKQSRDGKALAAQYKAAETFKLALK